MSWDGRDGTDWNLHLKEAKVDPDRKLNQLTVCARFYHLAYNKEGIFSPICISEAVWMDVETNGYTERLAKLFYMDMYGPADDNPFDITVWNWASRSNHSETKTEWSYFRLSPQGMNALEWHHICFVYNVPGKNTGIVLNGEILANRNHSDLWANDDNFYTGLAFQPQNYTNWR